MPYDLLDGVCRRIEEFWANSGAQPDFIEVLRRVLMFLRTDSPKQRETTQWANLPGLCCQAAGGVSSLADDIATAWLLFYVGAHIMDNVEDQDIPDSWWEELGPGVAVNAASGLFFSASLALNNLYHQEATCLIASELVEDFNNSFLTMCGGQHRDLIRPEPTLEQFWEIAEAKSGTFFSLACRTGARLATDDFSRLEGFSEFGFHLGILIQILDELEDIMLLTNSESQPIRYEIRWPLPIIYAMEVIPPQIRDKLRNSLRTLGDNVESIDELLGLIDQSGASLYIVAEIEQHKSQALNALEKAAPKNPAGEVLVSYIHDIRTT